MRVPRRIFGPTRDQIVGGWRYLHNGELYNMCASPNVIKMLKSRREMDKVYSTHAIEEECM
jgi:hypothetical protein